jgi:hypothetical protein
MNVPAEALGWSLTLGREGLFGLSRHQKPARSGFGEGWVIYPPYPMGVPIFIWRGERHRQASGREVRFIHHHESLYHPNISGFHKNG